MKLLSNTLVDILGIGVGIYISFIEVQTMCKELSLFSHNASDPDIFV